MACEHRGAAGRVTLGDLAASTPPSRDRYVDLLRAVAILLVVLGHWLAAVVYTVDGRIAGVNALTVLPWTHAATWLFQVMPVFFLVGGFANAASWTSAAGRGEPAATWVRARTERITRPVTAFLIAVVAASVLARIAGADGELVSAAAWLSGIALWFLAAYLGVAAATPLTWSLHGRFGLAAPIVMGLGVAMADVAHRWFGVPAIGWANAVLLWAAVHQLGFSWHDGRLRRGSWPGRGLALGGLVAMLALTGPGPYPVSMVSVPGEAIQNASPPSLALLALAVTQTGLVLLLHDAGERWCRGRRRWRAVVVVNSVVLSVYLWHMAVVAVAAVGLYGTGLFPQPPVGSPAWYALRPLWIVALTIGLVVVLLVVHRFERPRRAPVAGPGARPGRGLGRGLGAGVVIGVGVVATCLGLVVLTIGGLSPPGFAGVPVAGLGLFLGGRLLLQVADPRRARPAVLGMSAGRCG